MNKEIHKKLFYFLERHISASNDPPNTMWEKNSQKS